MLSHFLSSPLLVFFGIVTNMDLNSPCDKQCTWKNSKHCVRLQQQTRDLEFLSLLIYKVSSNLGKSLTFTTRFSLITVISTSNSLASLSLPGEHFPIWLRRSFAVIIVIIINADFAFRRTLPKYSNEGRCNLWDWCCKDCIYIMRAKWCVCLFIHACKRS